jgi:protein-S-isoprenylcysteine O-methyltransferase Ste14
MTTVERADEKLSTAKGIWGWVLQITVYTLLIAGSLFISYGHLDWVMAWAYVGLFVISQALTALILMPKNPELLVARTQRNGDAKDWDKLLSRLVALFGPLSMWVVAGLDVRCGWSARVSLAVQIVALAIAGLGSLLTVWAMASNRFFYGFVRIKKGGHAVATAGPYRYVRHPGYAGGIIFDLATPLALGALWAFVPAVLTVGAIFGRTALEDRTLQDELDGYRDYTQRVRDRLLPGIW